MKLLHINEFYSCKYFAIIIVFLFFTQNLKSLEQLSDLPKDFEYRLNQSWRYREYNLPFENTEIKIWELIETPDSTIWVITNKGIVYFDKYKWVIKTNEDINFKILPNLYTNYFSIVTGEKDNLYYIQNNQLYNMNKSTKQLIHINYDNKELTINDIVKYNGYLAVLGETKENKIKKIYLLNKNFKIIREIGLPPEFNKFTAFYINRTIDQSLWISSDKGIYFFDNNKWNKIITSTSLIDINKIIKFKNEYLLFLNYPIEFQGLWIYNNKSIKKQNNPLIDFQAIDKYKDKFILAIFYTGNIAVYDSNWHLINNAPYSLRLANKILFTKNGDLWSFSTNKIHRFLLSNSLWEYRDYKYSFNSSSINDIIISKDDYLWVATGDDGVEKWKNNRLIQRWNKISNTRLLAVTSIIEDKFGRIWIGSGSHFTNTYYLSDNKWTKFDILPDKHKLYVHKIKKDSKGRLWFLTLSDLFGSKGYGAICYDYDTLTIWNKDKGLLSNRIYDFVEDSTGAYWFATYEGLCRFKNNKWTYWNKQNGLLSNKIFTLELHPNGQIIYFSNSTFGGYGIIKNDSIIYKYNNNLYNISVRDFVFDKYGNLWISSLNGIFCNLGNNLIHITEQEGLSNERCWPLFVDKQKLFVGTRGSGINILLYDYHEKFPPKVEFDYNLKNNHLTINCNIYSYDSFFDNASYYIKYKHNNGKWTKWYKNTNIELLDLNYGNHNFKFKIMSPLGFIYDKEYSLKLKIKGPIYYEIQFLIPIFLLVTLIIGLTVNFAIKRQKYIKRVEKINKDLHKSEQLYKSMFDKASDGILISKNGKIQYWNTQLLTLSGYEHNDLYNKNLIDFIDENHRSMVIEIQKALISDKTFPERLEFQIIKKDGSNCWVTAKISLLHKTQRDYETLIFLSDIDTKKQYELKLKNALLKEAEISEMKSSIISTISHLYRTPLTIIQNSVDLLKLHYKSKDEQKIEKYINRINLSIDRMIDFLEDIMFLGKIESKNYELSFEKLELQSFCHDVINNVIANNDSSRKIHNSIKEKFILNTDRTLLHTILYRVLDNAIKFSGNDSDIYFNFQKYYDYIIFDIIDSGCGIEPKILKNIFDPYYRINNGEQKKGTGFGLTIVKACVEILNGEIEISSNVNEGTNVTIKLPINND